MFPPTIHSALSNTRDNAFVSMYLKRDLSSVFVLNSFYNQLLLYTFSPSLVINLRFIVGVDFRPKYK